LNEIYRHADFPRQPGNDVAVSRIVTAAAANAQQACVRPPHQQLGEGGPSCPVHELETRYCMVMYRNSVELTTLRACIELIQITAP
jgi:hypothetical protein